MDKIWKSNIENKALLETLKKSDTIVVYDLETTGLSPAKERIIQFSAVRYDLFDLSEIERENFYIQIPFSLNPKITEITGITDEMLENEGISEEEAFNRISNFIGDNELIAGYNNTTFDNKYMENLYAKYGRTFTYLDNIDVYSVAKRVIPSKDLMIVDEKTGKKKPSYKLCYTTGYYDPDNSIQFHSSINDVEATWFVFKNLLKDIETNIEKENEKEAALVSIPKRDAKINSISYFSPSHILRMVYVNTSQGTFFYNDIKHEWKAKNGNMDSIDMNLLKERVLKVTETGNEDEMVKKMSKIRSIKL